MIFFKFCLVVRVKFLSDFYFQGHRLATLSQWGFGSRLLWLALVCHKSLHTCAVQLLCTKAPLIYLSPIANKFMKSPLLKKTKLNRTKEGDRASARWDSRFPWPVEVNTDKDSNAIWVVPLKKVRSGTNLRGELQAKSKKKKKHGIPSKIYTRPLFEHT